MEEKKIGIVGGLGPYAGMDLCWKILSQTLANSDQDHLSLAILSMPKEIKDRTEFLLGQSIINPAHAIAKMIIKLEQMGAEVIGIPCNTSHVPEIYDQILQDLHKFNSKVKLVHLLNEVANFLLEYYPEVSDVGVLSTNGVYYTNTYYEILKSKGFNVILPSYELQTNVIHKAIYDPKFGIKAKSFPVTDFAQRKIMKGINYLRKKNAQAIILGCTELGLAVSNQLIGNSIIIDSNLVLARALIREAAPWKLKPYRKIYCNLNNISIAD